MIHTLLSLSSFLSVLSISAKTIPMDCFLDYSDFQSEQYSKTANQHSTTVLTADPCYESSVIYRFAPGEVIYNSEYHFGHHSNGQDFMMITQNPDGLQNLVINGRKIKTAKDIYIYFADSANLNNYVYSFTDGNDRYLVLPNEQLGPYTSFSWPDFAPGDNNKARFEYRRMGMLFLHDYDGTITRLSENYEIEDPEVIYHSPNGQHSVRFELGNRKMEFDGCELTFPEYFTSASANSIDVYDCGMAQVTLSLEYDNGKSDYKCFVISPKGIVEIDREMTVDPISGKIVQVQYKNNRLDESVFYNTQLTIEYAQDGNDWKSGAVFALQDKSKKHEFLSNWKYDYVMIDNVRMGKYAPISASYDADANAFVWITIEDNQLVRNIYRL